MRVEGQVTFRVQSMPAKQILGSYRPPANARPRHAATWIAASSERGCYELPHRPARMSSHQPLRLQFLFLICKVPLPHQKPSRNSLFLSRPLGLSSDPVLFTCVPGSSLSYRENAIINPYIFYTGPTAVLGCWGEVVGPFGVQRNAPLGQQRESISSSRISSLSRIRYSSWRSLTLTWQRNAPRTRRAIEPVTFMRGAIKSVSFTCKADEKDSVVPALHRRNVPAVKRATTGRLIIAFYQCSNVPKIRYSECHKLIEKSMHPVLTYYILRRIFHDPLRQSGCDLKMNMLTKIRLVHVNALVQARSPGNWCWSGLVWSSRQLPGVNSIQEAALQRFLSAGSKIC
ncbi:uncharacterized protein MYCFIDRAFT_172894 [Pseudocercospora fijiensis CIRAD86]|uniref:Uncharacterized protein n=1 Tax=Pseudocercospora fijiensis (strain CIRAD86) TaxID=383855 RepID=M2ZXZ5_PSEFD|nr:uncharacterized protein MYCFIDRAFT_172894 [Pseudocercospora fijiensis CIRAD86]EME83819.1 hypothetical protein MYCFIDRAFT_172894 [Pseudocercospora fijiensis CIRAD86]